MKLRLLLGMARARTHLTDAARRLIRRPRSLVFAACLLGPCFGASLAIFGTVDGMLFQPLPFERADRLLLLQQRNVATGRSAASISALEYLAIREMPQLAGATSFWSVGDILLAEMGGQAYEFGYAAVDDQFCDVLGLRLAAGRCPRFDELVSNRPVVVISDRVRKTLFRESPNVLGRTFRQGERTMEVVGVLPATFLFPAFIGQQPDVLVPMVERARPATLRSRVMAIVRTREGIADAELQMGIARTIREEQARVAPQAPQAAGTDIRAMNLQRALFEQHRQVLWIFVIGGVMLLVAAAANFGLLLLDMIEGRRIELATRLALGMPPVALVTAWLVEAAAIAVAANGAAIAMFWLTQEWLVQLLPSDTFVVMSSTVGPRTLAVGGLTAAFVVCLASIALVPELLRIRPSATLVASRSRPQGFRHGLAVAVQLSVGIAVAAVSLSLVAALRSRSAESLGLNPANTIVVESLSTAPEYRSLEGRSRLFLDTLTSIRTISAVTAAGASTGLPLTGTAPERELGPESTRPGAVVWRTTPQYFGALGLTIVGRDFADRDAIEQTTIIVNRTLAERTWPGQSPLGKSVTLASDQPMREVIAVAPDLRQRFDDRPEPAVYLPMKPSVSSAMRIVARVDGGGSAAVAAVTAELRRSLPRAVFRVYPLSEHVGKQVAYPRFQARLLAAVAGLTLLLCVISILLISWRRVSSHRQDYGIRLGLGATPSQLQRRLVVDQLPGILAGLSGGAGLALIANRLVASVAVEIPSLSIAAAAVSALIFVASAIAAVGIASRRIVRIPISDLLKAT